MKLLLATSNAGKAREMAAGLAGLGFTFVDLQQWLDLTPPVEDGATFAENARLKAEYYFQRTQLPALADDAGLMVDALDGAPGLHSARYAASTAERNQKLIDSLAHLPPDDPLARSARFHCALCMITPERCLEVAGQVEGTILDQPRGEGGFGYDSIFFHPPTGKTFAELTISEKNQVSHRAVALRRLRDSLG